MELRAQPMSPEPFGPWEATRMRRLQDMDLTARARHPQLAISTPSGSSPPYRLTLTREAPSLPKSYDEVTQVTNPRYNGNSRSEDYPIMTTESTDAPDCPSTEQYLSPQDEGLKVEGKGYGSGPPQRPGLGTILGGLGQRLQSVAEEEKEEEDDDDDDSTKPDSTTQLRRGTEDAHLTLPFRPSPSPGPMTSGGATTMAKRIRDTHDVDGPGTGQLPIKKRRLLLRLVTSRLSRPFSSPATYLVIRKATPVLHHRIPLNLPPSTLQHSYPFSFQIPYVYSSGTRSGGKVGHLGSALIRKVAILNRIRIRARQAVSLRTSAVGGVGAVNVAEIAGLGANMNWHRTQHGMSPTMTAPETTGQGLSVPGLGPEMGMGMGGYSSGSLAKPAAPVWRQYSPGLRPYMGISGSGRPDATSQYQTDERLHGMAAFSDPAAANMHQDQITSSEQYTLPSPTPSIPPRPPSFTQSEASEEEDNTAFPASGFRDRYVDLSDDDMDDVYADFGVLFGPGPRSPEARSVGSPVEEQSYEEYLDGLDGIPWDS